MIVTKPIDLDLLSQELAAAAVTVNGLGMNQTATPGESELYTYDAAGSAAELPPAAVPVVDAHVAPPPMIDYSGSIPVAVRLRTTDDQPHEIYRLTCETRRRYRANLIIDGIDATSFDSKVMEGRFVWKRVTGNVLMVGAGGGIAVISDLHDAATASWLPNCLPSGTAVVFTVKGALGRTIDWKLEGAVDVFAPDGDLES